MIKPEIGKSYNIGSYENFRFLLIARDVTQNIHFIFANDKENFVISKDEWYSVDWQKVIRPTGA